MKKPQPSKKYFCFGAVTHSKVLLFGTVSEMSDSGNYKCVLFSVIMYKSASEHSGNELGLFGPTAV